MVLVIVRQEAGLCEGRPTQKLHSEDTQMRVGNSSRQPINSKTVGKRQPKNKSQLALSFSYGSCEVGVEVHERMMMSEN
jgi:hypothetical protein